MVRLQVMAANGLILSDRAVSMRILDDEARCVEILEEVAHAVIEGERLERRRGRHLHLVNDRLVEAMLAEARPANG